MLANLTQTQWIVAAAGAGAILLWLLPAALVGIYAERRGFPFWVFFLAALLVSWPLMLVVTAVTGSRSPLVAAIAARGTNAD